MLPLTKPFGPTQWALLGLITLSTCVMAQVPTEDAAFTDYVAQVIRAEVGDTPVSVKGPLTLSVGSLQGNLDRISAFCKGNSEKCAGEVERYAKGVSQVLKQQNAPIDKTAIRIVIRSAEYVRRAQASFGADGPTLQTKPLVDGLFSVAVLDTPRALRPLDDRDLKKLGLSQDDVFALGAENLLNTLQPLSEKAKPVASGQIGSITGSVYEVGRLAVQSQWASLAVAQNGTLLVSLPSTDVVLYVSEGTNAAVDALRTLATHTAAKSPNPLAPLVLKWTPERWELVP
jgi:uncharacterized protein YtpQ (UPF0354 family)